ncbi:MFS transporter [Ruminococcaceae bacterium OttesenSCG-928-N02]|nr:MFS transporter [Ruminococcaceae bacterium OttesenSCG-928-N02]
MAKPKKKKPATGVLIAGAMVVVPGALPGLWGTFQKAVCEGYGISEAQAGMIFTCTIASFGLACIITGALGDKLGPKMVAGTGACLLLFGFCSSALMPQGSPFYLCLGYSVPIGLGCACLYPPAMSCVQKHYPQRKGLATGVLGASLGLSGAAITYGGRALIHFFGIRVCFLVLGIVLFALVFTGAMGLWVPAVAPGLAQNKRGLTPREMAGTAPYYLLLAATFLATPTTQLFSPRVVEMGMERGLSEGAAVLSLALSSLANGAGRFAMPMLSDKLGRPKTSTLSFLLLGVASCGLWWAKGFWVPIMYGITTFFYSGQNAVMPAYCSDLFGLQHSGANYGLIAIGMTFGALAFPPLAQVYGGGYLPRHIIAICSASLGCVCVLFAGKLGNLPFHGVKEKKK